MPCSVYSKCDVLKPFLTVYMAYIFSQRKSIICKFNRITAHCPCFTTVYKTPIITLYNYLDVWLFENMAKLVAVCSYGVMGKFSNLLLVVVTSMTLSTWFPYRAKRLVHGPSLEGGSRWRCQFSTTHLVRWSISPWHWRVFMIADSAYITCV